MSVSMAFAPEAVHPAAEPFGYRPLAAIAAAAAGGVPQKRIGRVLAEVAPVLMGLHDGGSVHGAISVNTVGLDEFGYAHVMVPALYPDRPDALEPASCFTAAEQFDSEPAGVCTPATDVYALSALVCSLVSGSAPPHALARRAQEHYVPLSVRRPPGYDDEFLGVIDRGLSLAPSLRPQSVADFCAALGVTVQMDAEGPADAAETAPAVLPAPARDFGAGGANGNRRLGAALAIAAGVLAVILVWVGAGRSGAPDEGSSGLPVEQSPAQLADSSAPPSRRDVGGEPRTGSAERPFPAATGTNTTGGGPGSRSVAAMPDGTAAPAAAGLAGEGPALALSQDTGASSGARPGLASKAAGGATADRAAASPGSRTPAPAGSAAGGPATDTAEAARPARGTVSIDIRPWGEIIVDGVARGVSPPMKSLSLREGRHSVVVRNADLPPYRTTVDIKAGASAAIRHVFR